MPSSVAVMISDDEVSASALLSSTGKLATRLNISAADTLAVVASSAAVSALKVLYVMLEPPMDGFA
jgi:hypothetical protein